MSEKRLAYFYKLQDVIQEGRQRNLRTKQADISHAAFFDQQGIRFSMLLKLNKISWTWDPKISLFYGDNSAESYQP